ncbi:MAG: tetratricopeptide repeat protein, partial [Bacteroidales bacterium]|nr:tetratricopeptide repeat protein [Bacteroidales bacterium]
MLGGTFAGAQTTTENKRTLSYAISLYENGLLSQAKTILDGLGNSDETTVKAYSLLCSIDLRVPTYDQEYYIFKKYYLDCAQTPLIDYKYALSLYDRGEYQASLALLDTVDTRFLSKKDFQNCKFFRAQCNFCLDNYDVALGQFEEVLAFDTPIFNPQCCYCLGYICYQRKEFEKSLEYFSRIVEDDNFSEIAKYYALECSFMLNDYGYVTSNGPAIFDRSPQERKPHLARIISESYMMEGDYVTAQEYYNHTDSDAEKSDADLYYAGSLLYLNKDYKGAVENFSKIRPQDNALYQQATYNLAYSYLNMKNKIAALECYKMAASLDFDKTIKKDAMINYAKLAFDLNKDDSGFEAFASAYPKDSENDKFYSYMAIAALQNGDYNAAISAYDRIENFDEDERLNYAKANYLRARELYTSKAFSSCESYFKTASFYAGKDSDLSKYSQYLLASSYYNSEKYKEAADKFISLYNSQTLFPRPENDLLPYDIAYCYFSMKDYQPAEKWFQMYAKSDKADSQRKKDAILRGADSQFMLQKFSDAAASYSDYIAMDAAPVYPYYQAGLSYGLAGNVDKKITVLSSIPQTSWRDYYYAPAMFELGRAYEKKKKYDSASKTYLAIINTLPTSQYAPQSLLQLGMLYRGRKDDNQALKYYCQLVESYPESEYYQSALSQIESIYISRNNPKGYYNYV